MDIAINTGSLSFNTPEALERARALGFAAVEVNLQQAELRYDYNRKVDYAFYERLAQQAAALGLKIVSVHAPALTPAQAFSSRARGQLLKAGARIGAALGAPALVAHPADVFKGEEELDAYFEGGPGCIPPVVDGFDETWAQLANKRMALALENVNYWRGAPGTNQPARMARLLVDLAVHAVLDVRRAVVGPNAAASLGRWLEGSGARTVLLHAHDASPDGAREHLPPLAETWSVLAPQLRGTRARACVLEADAVHGDDKVVESRVYFERLFAAGS